jgi:hypothetical protein
MKNKKILKIWIYLSMLGTLSFFYISALYPNLVSTLTFSISAVSCVLLLIGIMILLNRYEKMLESIETFKKIQVQHDQVEERYD